MRRAAVLGKGSLAVHACETLTALPGIVLDTVIPNSPEPGWDVSLTDTVTTRWPDVRIIGSGDWRDLEPGRCDLVLSILYDKIIGPELIDATPQIINCHPGRLPQYRGVGPVNWALRNGEDLAGITLHVIDNGVDTGPVLAEALFSIWPEVDEVRDVWWRGVAHGRQLLTDTLPRLDQIVPRPQDPALAVTHYSQDNDQLGERSDWTRDLSGSPPN